MKRAAFAGPIALEREASFGPSSVALPGSGQRTRDLNELASKTIIVTLFSLMAVRLAADFRATGHVTGLLLLASEALVVVLTMFRRSAETVDRSVPARVLTALSMVGPPLVRPVPLTAVAPETFTAMLSAVGLLIVVIGKVSLGRSFGLTPANRGIVCTGVYRLPHHAPRLPDGEHGAMEHGAAWRRGRRAGSSRDPRRAHARARPCVLRLHAERPLADPARRILTLTLDP